MGHFSQVRFGCLTYGVKQRSLQIKKQTEGDFMYYTYHFVM